MYTNVYIYIDEPTIACVVGLVHGAMQLRARCFLSLSLSIIYMHAYIYIYVYVYICK